MKLKLLFASLALMCLSIACSDHPTLTYIDEPEQPADSGYVSIDLRTNEQTSRGLRAHDPLQSVRHITFLFFHETESRLLFSRTMEPTSSLTFELKIPKQNYRLAVVLNAGDIYTKVFPELLSPTASILATTEGFLDSYLLMTNGGAPAPADADRAVTMANDQGLVTLSSAQIVNKKTELTDENRLNVRVEPCLARVLVVGKPTVQGGTYESDSTYYAIDVVPLRIYPLRHLSKLANGANELAGDGSLPQDRYALSWAEASLTAGATYSDVYKYVKASHFASAVVAAKMQEKKENYNLNSPAIYAKEVSVAPTYYYTAYVPRVVLRAVYVPHGIAGVNPKEGWVEFQGRKMSLAKFKGFVDEPTTADAALAESIRKAQTDGALVFTSGFSSHGINFYHQSHNYYAIPIRHFDDDKAPNQNSYGRFGLIRNNEYLLTVKSITGPGSSVIPAVSATEAVEKDGYASAAITVNQTTGHQQDVDL